MIKLRIKCGPNQLMPRVMGLTGRRCSVVGAHTHSYFQNNRTTGQLYKYICFIQYLLRTNETLIQVDALNDVCMTHDLTTSSGAV